MVSVCGSNTPPYEAATLAAVSVEYPKSSCVARAKLARVAKTRMRGFVVNGRSKTCSMRAIAPSTLEARRTTSGAGMPASTRTSARTVRTVDSGTVVSRRALVPTGTFTQNWGMKPVVGAQVGPSFALAWERKTNTRASTASTPTPATVRSFFTLILVSVTPLTL